MSKQYDLVAIGDVVTDAFIRIKDASVNCDINHEKCRISMNFADKVPYEFVEVVRAVGNAANGAASAARLGLKTAFVTNLGDDQNGGECLATLKRNGISLEFIKAHRHKETNYHYVLWYEDDRTILVRHEEYDYKLPDFGEPKWVYFSSIAPSAIHYHAEIVDYLDKHPSIKLAFQPGVFEIKMGHEKLKGMYRHSEIFFCNVEEAKRVLGIIEHIEIPSLIKKMRDLGPKIVVITDGHNGAYAFDGENIWSMPIYPDPKPPYERTGAGDAFASTVTSALALGKPLEEALRWGPINSMSVVQYIGAQKGLLDQNAIQKYLSEAPENYKPTLIS
jgi:2-dehydro-3-deoxygluconokinase